MGSTSTISATSLTATPSGAPTSRSTTHPVSVLEPTGTRTRAPTAGTSMSSGRRYVSRSRNGTGTATEIQRMGRFSGVRSQEAGGRARVALYLLTPISYLLRQELSDALHIFPDFALRRRGAEQVGRMVGRHENGVSKPVL